MNTRDKPTCPPQSNPVTTHHAQRSKGKPAFKLNFDALKLENQKKSMNTENFASKTKGGLSESTNVHTAGKTPNTKLKLNLDELNMGQRLPTETVTKSSRHDYHGSANANANANANHNKHRRIMSNREENFFMLGNNNAGGNGQNPNGHNLQNVYLPRNHAHANAGQNPGSGGMDLQAAIADAKNLPKKIFKSVANPPKVGNFIPDAAKMSEKKNLTANFPKPKKSQTKTTSGIPISKKSLDNFMYNHNSTKEYKPKSPLRKTADAKGSSVIFTNNNAHYQAGNLSNNKAQVPCSFVIVGSPGSTQRNGIFDRGPVGNSISAKFVDKVFKKKQNLALRQRSKDKDTKSCAMKQADNSSLSNVGYWNTKNVLMTNEGLSKLYGKEVSGQKLGSRFGGTEKISKTATLGKYSSTNFSQWNMTAKEKDDYQNGLMDHVNFLQTKTKFSQQARGPALRSKSAKKTKLGQKKYKCNKKSGKIGPTGVEKLRFNDYKNLNSKNNHQTTASGGQGGRNFYPNIEDLKYCPTNDRGEPSDPSIEFKDYFQNACAEIIQKTWRLHLKRKAVQRSEKIKRIEQELNFIESSPPRTNNNKHNSHINLNYSNQSNDSNEMIPVCIKSSPPIKNTKSPVTIDEPDTLPVKMVNNDLLPKSTKDNSLIMKEIGNNEQSRTIIGTNNGSSKGSKGDTSKTPVSDADSKREPSSGELPKGDFVKKYKSFASDQIKRWEDVISNIKDFQDVNSENPQETCQLEGMLDNLEKQGLVNLRILHDMIKVSKVKKTPERAELKAQKLDSSEKNLLFTNTVLEKLTEREKSSTVLDKKNFAKKKLPESDLAFAAQQKNYLLNNNNNHIAAMIEAPKAKNLPSPTSPPPSSSEIAQRLSPKGPLQVYKNLEQRANNIQDTLSSQYFEGDSNLAMAKNYPLTEIPKKDPKKKDCPDNPENFSKQNKRELIKSDGILINTDI